MQHRSHAVVVLASLCAAACGPGGTTAAIDAPANSAGGAVADGLLPDMAHTGGTVSTPDAMTVGGNAGTLPTGGSGGTMTTGDAAGVQRARPFVDEHAPKQAPPPVTSGQAPPAAPGPRVAITVDPDTVLRIIPPRSSAIMLPSGREMPFCWPTR